MHRNRSAERRIRQRDTSTSSPTTKRNWPQSGRKGRAQHNPTINDLALTWRLVPRIKLIPVKQWTFDAKTKVDELVQRFEKEIRILRKLKHPNIINLIGFVKNTEKERAWIIFPWASHGNINQFLKTGNWEIPERVALIEDVARGLSFLHAQNPPICHGDLKSLNIVVNQNFEAIIADFGSARILSSRKAKRPRPGTLLRPRLAAQPPGHSNHSIQSLISSMSSLAIHTGSGPAWTTRWASPEVLSGHKTSLAGDIWALGWVCWEIITDHMPFHDVSNSHVIWWIIQGRLPSVNSNEKLAQLQTMCTMVMACWQEKPRRRPTAADCLEVIEQVVRRTAEHIERSEHLGLVQPSARPSNIVINHKTGDRIRSAALLNALGELNSALGKYDRALEEYEESLTISKSENDNRLSFRVLGNIGDIRYSEGRWEDAVDAYEEAQRLAHLAGFKGLNEALLCRLMDSYTALGCLQTAQEVLDSVILDPPNDRGWEVVVESAYKLGNASYDQGQYARATLVYQRARSIHRNKDDYTEPLYSLHHLAILYCLQGRYADADEIFEKVKISQNPPPDGISGVLVALRGRVRSLHGKKKGKWADALLGFGTSFSKQGRYIDALAVYHEIRHLREVYGGKKELANTLERIGYIYVKLERWEEAESAYAKGHDIYLAEEDQPGMVKLLLCLTHVYCKGRLYDDAIHASEQARTICFKEGLKKPLVGTLNRLGEAYRLLGRYKDASQAFREARKVAAQEEYPDGKAEALKGLGMTFADEQNYEEAVKRLKRAAAIFREIGKTKSLSKCNLAIAEIEALDLVSDVE
ncbi:hypothetical protein FS837_009461 [Tulasnella sp. UAMH 9824]|nr:hypothetical protein FS837_009461 [Tulasnella sp. UAMH 9824]